MHTIDPGRNTTVRTALGVVGGAMLNPPFVTDVAFGSAAQRQDVRQRVEPCSRWSVAGQVVAFGKGLWPLWGQPRHRGRRPSRRPQTLAAGSRSSTAVADGVGGELVVVQGSRATWSQVWVPSRALARSERNGSMPNTPFVTDRAARGRTTARR